LTSGLSVFIGRFIAAFYGTNNAIERIKVVGKLVALPMRGHHVERSEVALKVRVDIHSYRKHFIGNFLNISKL